MCCVWIVSDDGNRNKFSVRVDHTARPIDVISEVIRRRGRLMDITKQQVEGLIESYRSTYALKVCGCDEFLLSENPISQYRVCFQSVFSHLSYCYDSFVNLLSKWKFMWGKFKLFTQKAISHFVFIKKIMLICVLYPQHKLIALTVHMLECLITSGFLHL